ncbi:helix-turn-helix transcriptional regulator [uncultured Alistipes sp.]|uniref:helix-turn-helix domain-containing protein n=1 Tax=uncultured Alistipes sp. TaxID=538949 RepID=UPI00259B1E90|nr:helix-turn-helix transcriptional regulator [uncultured Alistipes sp.]
MKRQIRESVKLAVAARLRELREQKGVSQESVYIDTDLNIGRIEAAMNNLTIDTLAILCDYYGVTFEEFFRGIKTK